jgi:exodeoxyribonuclease V alpha subunit
VLQQVGEINDQDSLQEIFANIFEYGNSGVLNLEKVQIITPRRVGSFGSTAINTNVIRDGKSEFLPRTKLICEKNRYIYINRQGQNKRVLALANGSLGYIQANGEPHFHDLDDFEKEFGRISEEIRKIKKEVSADFNGLGRDIDFGDVITVHKAQGSDYDVVIFVIPEIGPFIVRELLYTAFTRAKSKLYVVIHENLKEE